jgi:precorrin-2 dehydrogenase / sirohydrochlorin ferrochelatase
MNEKKNIDSCRCGYTFPVFLNLADRRCLVAGGGKVAFRKITDLVETGAQVTVVAETAIPEIECLAKDGAISLHIRKFEPDDVSDVFLVFAATDSNETNAQIAKAARAQGALVNAVDNPPSCDFFSGALIKQGPLRIAVSTSGCLPGAAALVRDEMEACLDEGWGAYLDAARELRRRVIARTDVPPETRCTVMDWLVSRNARRLFANEGIDKVWAHIEQIVSS